MARQADARHQLPPSARMGVEQAGRVSTARGHGARIPGWHVHEVYEALRHFEGAKESVREVAALMQAAAPDPAVAEQHHLELLAATLYSQVQGGASELARAIRFVRHAAALALLGEEPQRPSGPLSVLPGEPLRPSANGGAAQ